MHPPELFFIPSRSSPLSMNAQSASSLWLAAMANRTARNIINNVARNIPTHYRFSIRCASSLLIAAFNFNSLSDPPLQIDYSSGRIALHMKTKDLLELGVPLGKPQRRAVDFIASFLLKGGDKTRLSDEIRAIVANPAAFAEDPLRGELAKSLANAPPPPRANPVPYQRWGDNLEAEAVNQMDRACMLPVAVAGALMPDAH